MSRSGYSDSCDGWDLIRWRGAVASAIRGKRGQAFLKEMLSALDALPEPKLVANALEADGAVCAMGAVGKARGVDMGKVDADDRHAVAAVFGIPMALAAEIAFENDEGTCHYDEPPEARFARVRRWVDARIDKPPPE